MDLPAVHQPPAVCSDPSCYRAFPLRVPQLGHLPRCDPRAAFLHSLRADSRCTSGPSPERSRGRRTGKSTQHTGGAAVFPWSHCCAALARSVASESPRVLQSCCRTPVFTVVPYVYAVLRAPTRRPSFHLWSSICHSSHGPHMDLKCNPPSKHADGRPPGECVPRVDPADVLAGKDPRGSRLLPRRPLSLVRHRRDAQCRKGEELNAMLPRMLENKTPPSQNPLQVAPATPAPAHARTGAG